MAELRWNKVPTMPELRYIPCLVLSVAIVAASLGCDRAAQVGGNRDDADTQLSLKPDQVASLFGTQGTLDVVKEPDLVTAFRLSPNRFNERMIKDYQVSAGPLPLPRPMAAEFAATLTDATSYRWNEAKACEPDYGVRLQFERGEQTVDVLLCLECLILAVHVDGQPIGQGNFDNAAPRIIGLVKQIFPDDPKIQALP
jgi:hypothetical protein